MTRKDIEEAGEVGLEWGRNGPATVSITHDHDMPMGHVLPSLLVEGPTMTRHLLRLLDAIDSEDPEAVSECARAAEEDMTEAFGIPFPDTEDDA